MTTYIGASYLAATATRSVTLVHTGLFDFPVYAGTKSVSGTVYDVSGSAVTGATVVLIRDSDYFPCQVTTSDGSGNYSFTRDATDPNTYSVMAYSVTGGVTKVHGTSDRGVVPA